MFHRLDQRAPLCRNQQMPLACSSLLQTSYKTTLRLYLFLSCHHLNEGQFMWQTLVLRTNTWCSPASPCMKFQCQRRMRSQSYKSSLGTWGCSKQLAMFPEGIQMHRGQVRTPISLFLHSLTVWNSALCIKNLKHPTQKSMWAQKYLSFYMRTHSAKLF